MPVQKLMNFLNSQKVEYTTILHSKAYTAQEVAASAHIPGKEVAKAVIIKLDGKLAMAVLPADHKVDLQLLREASGANMAKIATESEFMDTFPNCEVGAMPPFGNLYGMDVYVEESLTKDETIAFNAGSHTELVLLAYDDFERLVSPKIFRTAEIYAGA